MTRFHTMTAVAVLQALLLTGAVYAQGPRGGLGRGPGGFDGLGLPIRELNLSDTQQQEIRAIRDRHREELQAAAKQLRATLEVQRKAIETIPVDEAAIRSATQDVSEAQTEVAVQQARLHSEVWAVFTPAQQEQAKKLEAERAARLEQRRQKLQQRR